MVSKKQEKVAVRKQWWLLIGINIAAIIAIWILVTEDDSFWSLLILAYGGGALAIFEKIVVF